MILLRDFWEAIKVLLKTHGRSPLRMASRKRPKPAVVLGNGPSLNLDFPFLVENRSRVKFFCVNEMACSDLFEKILPQYYLLLDPVYWMDGLSHRLQSLRDRTINCIERKVAWPLNLFFPLVAKGKPPIQPLERNRNVKLHFFHNLPCNGSFRLRMSFYNRNLSMPPAQNVLAAAIYLAIFVGFRDVWIFGADHSWHETLRVDGDNQILIKDDHFYENAKHQVWTDGVSESKSKSLSETFFLLSKMLGGYQEVQAYAEFVGAKVINASSKSYIDAFPRLPKEALVSS